MICVCASLISFRIEDAEDSLNILWCPPEDLPFSSGSLHRLETLTFDRKGGKPGSRWKPWLLIGRSLQTVTSHALRRRLVVGEVISAPVVPSEKVGARFGSSHTEPEEVTSWSP